MTLFFYILLRSSQTFIINISPFKTTELNHDQVNLVFAYHIYELIFKTKDYKINDIYTNYFEKVYTKSIPTSFFIETHRIILDRCFYLIKIYNLKKFKYSYNDPIIKFIKENVSFLQAQNLQIIKKYNNFYKKDEKIDKEKYVFLCINKYINIIIEQKLLNIEQIIFFIETIDEFGEGFYVKRYSLNERTFIADSDLEAENTKISYNEVTDFFTKLGTVIKIL